MTDNKKLETKRIIIFLVVTFVITYALEILVIWPLSNTSSVEFSQNSMLQLIIAGVMFIPAIGVLITRLVTKEGFKNSMIKPNFKGNIRYYLFAWLAPIILTIVGAVVYYLIFPQNFDITMKTTIDSYMAQYEELGMADAITREDIKFALLMQIPMIFIAPFMNIINCFGEEWGWRGYLLPKMQKKLPMLPMLLVNGVIWGLWHAPLTIIGHNYGTDYLGYPVTGILMMCGFCIVVGVIFSYITIKTDSVWPAVLAHGCINGTSMLSSLFHNGTPNPFIGPLPIGAIGGIGFIITAIIMAILLIKKPQSQTETNL
ncbi:MAG: type II CAAX endopeptidase family protein [Acutalibacteraceae bacterium]|nr:type II CAAX endopeptidase family protein [Acutalibacteraceae bacterium]